MRTRNFVLSGFRFILLLTLSMFFVNFTLAATYVNRVDDGHGGYTIQPKYITAATTWNSAGSPYICEDDVIVKGNIGGSAYVIYLTVENGVSVIFSPGAKMQLGLIGENNWGGLKATGATFTASSGAAGGWEGIHFTTSSTSSSYLNNCVVEYGGATLGANIVCEDSSPTLTNCQINNSSGKGLHADNLARPEIDNCVFNNNADYPLSVSPENVANLKTNVQGTGNNPSNVIEVRGGNLTVSATWLNHALPYRVNGTITIKSSIGGSAYVRKLTIANNSVVQFNTDTELIIGSGNFFGSLEAVNVTFQGVGNTPGYWRGIRFTDDTFDSTAKLENCSIYNAGNTIGAAIVCESSSPTILNCTILNSSSKGIYADDNSYPVIQNNTINNCGDYPISVNASNVYNLLADNQGAGNTPANVIIVRGGNVTTNCSWQKHSMIYRVTGNVTVKSSIAGPSYIRRLIIADNTVLEFADATELIIGDNNFFGGLIANNVTFTSITKTAGAWKGITFSQYTSQTYTQLTNCFVEYGSGNLNANINLISSNPIISDCVIRYSSGYGIYADDGSRPVLTSNNFVNNQNYPISIKASNCHTINDGNTGSGNLADVIYVRGGDVTASVNWEANPLPYRVNGTIMVKSTFGGSPYIITLTLKPDTIIQFEPGSEIILGLNNNWGMLIANEVVFTSSTNTPGTWKGITFSAYSRNSSYLKKCNVLYAGEAGSACITNNSQELLLENCFIGYSTGAGIVSNSSELNIINTMVVANQTALLSNATTIQMLSCTIADNTEPANGAVQVTSGSCTLKNTIVAYNGSGVKAASVTPAITYSNFYQNGAFDYSGAGNPLSGAGNQTIDPAFADKTNGDYHLTSTSGVRELGTNADSYTYIDYDGHSRLYGTATDIGADEYATGGGIIKLNDLRNPPGPNGKIVTIKVYQTGTTNLIDTFTVTLNAGGAYAFESSLTGTYDVWAKPTRWLSRRLPNVTFNPTLTLANFTDNYSLSPGDYNNDNVIDDFDLNEINGAFGSSVDPGTSGDLDEDGVIDDFDLNIVNGSFGAVGDN